jgi:hypothetical protein
MNKTRRNRNKNKAHGGNRKNKNKTQGGKRKNRNKRTRKNKNRSH